MQNLFVTLGVVAWIVASFFGFYQTIGVTQDVRVPGFSGGQGHASVTVPSSVSGATAGGFAIAGGLCFVAAALVSRMSPPSDKRLLRGAQVEPQVKPAEPDFAALSGALDGKSKPDVAALLATFEGKPNPEP